MFQFVLDTLGRTALPVVDAAHIEPMGALGVVAGLAAGLMPRRNLILLASALCSTLFCIHFVRLGSLTGAAMCAISLAQSLAAMRVVGVERPGWLGTFFIMTCGATIAFTALTWSGWPSFLASTGALIATVARLQTDTARMRLALAACTLCWIGHNIIVDSIFGLCCDVLTLSGLAVGLLRDRLSKTNEITAAVRTNAHRELEPRKSHGKPRPCVLRPQRPAGGAPEIRRHRWGRHGDGIGVRT